MSATRIKTLVWDLPLRITHWVLVLAFALSYITHLLGSDYYLYHTVAGYTVIVSVVFRLVWGAVGTYHARFANFMCGPTTTWRYFKSLGQKAEKRYVGHNPLGAIMVLLLLSCLLVQSVSGLFTSDDIFDSGPLHSAVSANVGAAMGAIHRLLFYWLSAFVVMHVAAVVYHSVIKKEGLIVAMVTGLKSTVGLEGRNDVLSSRTGFAVALFVSVTLFFALIIFLFGA